METHTVFIQQLPIGLFSPFLSHSQILQPFIFSIMEINCWKLDDLIRIYNKIYCQHRPLQHKGRQKSHRDSEAPEGYCITEKSESGISSCAENPPDSSSIYIFSHHIYGAHYQHPFQVAFRPGRQICNLKYHRTDQQKKDSGQNRVLSGEIRYPMKFRTIPRKKP